MEIQRCNRCVMDNATGDHIHFDSNGFCNYCSDIELRKLKEYFPNDIGEKKLEEAINNMKRDCKNEKYDCVVGVSGGVDSSYIIYIGKKFNLRMLAVHFDDGLDTPIAKENIIKLCDAASVELVNIKTNTKQYADLILSFFKASVQGITHPQDNIIFKELYGYIRKYNIKYVLNGANFAHESILERFDGVNASDGFHIKQIHKKFGKISISDIKLQSLFESYLYRRYFTKIKTIYPLNYINYNLEDALSDLNEFSGYEYYGGKHHESILTRFVQCYYLPLKFNFDKRKSHFSSLIMSGQMTREEAISLLEKNDYIDSNLYLKDMEFLAKFMNISVEEFREILALPPKFHFDYPYSFINKLSPIARKFRKYLK